MCSRNNCILVLYAVSNESLVRYEIKIYSETRDRTNPFYHFNLWHFGINIVADICLGRVSWNVGNLRILIERPTWNFQLSLVPFTVFKDYAKDLFRSPVFFFTTLINFFGNLAIFIPLGLLSALLFRKATWRRSAIIGFGLSTFIELFQYFIVRNTAIDDIILNTAGAMCGYLVYLLIKKRFPKFAAGFLCQEIK